MMDNNVRLPFERFQGYFTEFDSSKSALGSQVMLLELTATNQVWM